MSAEPTQEVRQDQITQSWVVCAPTRNHRPHAIDDDLSGAPDDLTPVEGCPFCPGHEAMLPEVLWELNGADGTVPWKTRVAPNKYPALTPDGDATERHCGLYRVRGGHGQQEVIIDTPYHYHTLATLPAKQVDAVVETYLARYHALRQAEEGLIPFVFRNHGADAGASLPHPHSQIIAPSLPPPSIQHEEARAEARYAETGHCAYCEMLDDTLDSAARVVWTNDTFVVFVPYAAQVPYAMWILPREHEAEMGRLDGERRRAFSEALHQALLRLHRALGDPDYNFFFRTALDYESDAPHLHWSLRIEPRTTIAAGFELGTGMMVNPSLPERDAEVLRSVDV